MAPRGQDRILAAIDVGTNAVRLELARRRPDGTFQTVHRERDPIRPGRGVFTTGAIPPPVVNRLVRTLRRYAALCRRHGAPVRAVATCALREALNGAEVVRRVRSEAGVALQVVSGREEARLVCLGVLHGASPRARSLVVDVGGGSTELAAASGRSPVRLWSVPVGAVRLTELFGTRGRVTPDRLERVRRFAAAAFRDALPPRLARSRSALGSAGTVRAVVAFAAGGSRASRGQVERAVEALAAMGPEERRRHFEPRRAEVVVAGAVVLEALMRRLRLDAIEAVDRGLRRGLLVDLSSRLLSAPAAGPEPRAPARGPRRASPPPAGSRRGSG